MYLESSIETYSGISDFEVLTIESLKNKDIQNNILLSMLINLKNY